MTRTKLSFSGSEKTGPTLTFRQCYKKSNRLVFFKVWILRKAKSKHSISYFCCRRYFTKCHILNANTGQTKRVSRFVTYWAKYFILYQRLARMTGDVWSNFSFGKSVRSFEFVLQRIYNFPKMCVCVLCVNIVCEHHLKSMAVGQKFFSHFFFIALLKSIGLF